MLSYQTIEPHTLKLLRGLMEVDFLCNFRLVGGTSLALQYGHRSSIDLDLFGTLMGDGESFTNSIRSLGQLQILKDSPSIKVYLVNGVKVDIVQYPYAWLSPMISEDGLRLASPKDIAAMKINAIVGRGSRKDFIDLYFLLEHYELKDILSFYCSKYPEHSDFIAIKSLTYFDDAELQPMPRMFSTVSWEVIKSQIVSAVSHL